MKKGTILLAEDDTNLGFVIKDNLEDAQYDVELYPDGEMALQAFARKDYDLCILDVMMPKKDGFTVAREMKDRKPQVPFLFVTAKSLQEDELTGLRLGAIDYIRKPFSMEALIQKVENTIQLFKRHSETTPPDREMWEIGRFTLDYKNLTLTHEGKSAQMTQKEADLLRLLIINKNNVVERNTILNLIWGDDSYFTGRSLDVFVSRLRAYLKPDSTLEIVNLRSVGFKLVVK